MPSYSRTAATSHCMSRWKESRTRKQRNWSDHYAKTSSPVGCYHGIPTTLSAKLDHSPQPIIQVTYQQYCGHCGMILSDPYCIVYPQRYVQISSISYRDSICLVSGGRQDRGLATYMVVPHWPFRFPSHSCSRNLQPERRRKVFGRRRDIILHSDSGCL